MTYDKTKIYKQAQELIKKNKLFFVEDIISMLAISKETFYRFYPVGSNEYDTIKSMLEQNKIEMKVSLRSKLYKGKGMELLALYKLIATDEERKALSMTFTENKTDLNIIPTFIETPIGGI